MGQVGMLEIIAETVADALAAEAGGATQVELVASVRTNTSTASLPWNRPARTSPTLTSASAASRRMAVLPYVTTVRRLIFAWRHCLRCGARKSSCVF